MTHKGNLLLSVIVIKMAIHLYHKPWHTVFSNITVFVDITYLYCIDLLAVPVNETYDICESFKCCVCLCCSYRHVFCLFVVQGTTDKAKSTYAVAKAHTLG